MLKLIIVMITQSREYTKKILNYTIEMNELYDIYIYFNYIHIFYTTIGIWFNSRNISKNNYLFEVYSNLLGNNSFV